MGRGEAEVGGGGRPPLPRADTGRGLGSGEAAVAAASEPLLLPARALLNLNAAVVTPAETRFRIWSRGRSGG